MSLPKPYYQSDKATLYCGDCLEILPHLSGVDCVVTDPPYGIGFSASPTKWSRNHVKRGREEWDNITPDVSKLVELGVPSAIWGGNHFQLPPSRGWLVWTKPPGLPSYGTSELCWTNVSMPVRHFYHARCDTKKENHPTQKPLAVMEWSLGFIKGDVILDPFTGSGTTGVAAVKLGRSFIGIEIEPKYCEIAKRRIIEAEEQFALFDPPKRNEQLELCGVKP